MGLDKLLVVVCSAFISCTIALQCNVGASIDAGDFFQYNVWNLTECDLSESSRCFRGEAAMDVPVFMQEVTVSAGSCLNVSSCQSACEDIIDAFIAEVVLSEIYFTYDPSVITIEMGQCESFCCEYDNCNSRSVEEVIRMRNQTTTRSSTTNQELTTIRSTADPTTSVRSASNDTDSTGVSTVVTTEDPPTQQQSVSTTKDPLQSRAVLVDMTTESLIANTNEETTPSLSESETTTQGAEQVTVFKIVVVALTTLSIVTTSINL